MKLDQLFEGEPLDGIIGFKNGFIHLRRPLVEASYKELAAFIDPNFLNQKVRAAELKPVRFVGFDPSDTIMFMVKSSKFDKNGIEYTNMIKFDQWDSVGNDPDLKTWKEKALMLLYAGDIRLSCSCPSFLYWGYQALLTLLDAAIYPEDRLPSVRNPKQRGIACKHMVNCLKTLPFYSGTIAKELKSQFGSE